MTMTMTMIMTHDPWPWFTIMMIMMLWFYYYYSSSSYIIITIITIITITTTIITITIIFYSQTAEYLFFFSLSPLNKICMVSFALGIAILLHICFPWANKPKEREKKRQKEKEPPKYNDYHDGDNDPCYSFWQSWLIYFEPPLGDWFFDIFSIALTVTLFLL